MQPSAVLQAAFSSLQWQVRERSVGLAIVLSVVVSYVMCVTPAAAQGSVFGALRGTVKDEHGLLLPGVTLTATRSDGTRVQETPTDNGGYYVFTQLLPGEYEVTAALTGFTTLVKPNVVIRTGMSVSLDLLLSVGGVAERVTVGKAPQLLESSSAAQTINLDGELARALPLTSRRRLDDLLLAVPGLTFEEFPGNNLYSLNGSGSSSHNVLVDGVEVKDPMTASITGLQLSYEAIQDIQITSSGQEPSAPLGFGVLVNISTAPGENQVHGTMSGLFQARPWMANNQAATSTANNAAQRRYGLVDGSFGGPIQESRAWYFGSIRFEDSSQVVNMSSNQRELFQAISPGFELPRADYRNVFFTAKATIAISANHLTSAFVQRDRRNALSVSSTVDRSFPEREGGTTVGWRLSSIWSRQLSTQASLSFTDRATDLPLAEPDLAMRRVYREMRPSGPRLVGVAQLGVTTNIREQAVDRRETRPTAAFDVTWRPERGFLGRHDVNFGVYLAPHTTAQESYIYANGGVALEEYVLANPNDVTSSSRVFARKIYDAASIRSLDTTLSDSAVYFGETWRPTDRITAKLGVRVDRVRQRDLTFARDVRATTSVGPRLGINVMLDGSGSTVARASWGRVHENPAEGAGLVGRAALGFRQEYDADGDARFETALVTPGATQANPNQVTDLERWGLPFIDETSVGVTRRIGEGSSASVSYTRRGYMQLGTQIEINGVYDATNRFLGYANESLNEIHLVTNNTWNWPVAHSVDLTWAGRFGRGDILLGYSRQWRALHGTWQPRDVAGILQPNAFPNHGALAETNFIRSASSYDEFPFRSWRDHVGRIAFNWLGPWNFLASSQVTVQSGPWSGPLFTAAVSPDVTYGPPTVVLSNGRVVANPLATLTRFVGPTRDDGQVRLDTHASWNLRLGRRFDLGRLQLDTHVDLFNLLNAAAPVRFAGGATTVESPNFLAGGTLQAPRSGTLSVRLAF